MKALIWFLLCSLYLLHSANGRKLDKSRMGDDYRFEADWVKAGKPLPWAQWDQEVFWPCKSHTDCTGECPVRRDRNEAAIVNIADPADCRNTCTISVFLKRKPLVLVTLMMMTTTAVREGPRCVSASHGPSRMLSTRKMSFDRLSFGQ